MIGVQIRAIFARNGTYAAAAITGLALMLLVGMLVPVYTDEIAWRFQMRAMLDGGFDIGANDLCGPNTIARAPWTMAPARWFSATANTIFADPFYVRLEGVICAFIALGLLWFLSLRLENEDSEKRGALRTVTFSLLGLGFLPFLFIMSRPEQPVIIGLLSIILVTFSPLRKLGPLSGTWVKVALILAAADVMTSYHFKGVLYLPVVFVCMILVTRGKGSLPSRFVGGAGLVVIGFVAAHYWISRFQCPGDPRLAAALGSENIAALLANGGDMGGLLYQILRGLNLLTYVQLGVPLENPVDFWMPPGLFPPPVSHTFSIAMTVLWFVAMVAAVATLLRFIYLRRLRALAEPRVPIALAIFGCIFVWGVSQITRYDYEASHVVPMLAVFVLLGLTLPTSWGPSGSMLTWLGRGAVVVALFSEAFVVARVATPLLNIFAKPGYIAAQPFSLSIAHYDKVKRDIADAMAKAGIAKGRRLRRVLVDDLTYFALQDSYMPLHRAGVLAARFNGSIEDPAAYLLSRSSDGVVVGCQYLTPDLWQVQSGEICAISRRGLEDVVRTHKEAAALPELDFGTPSE